MTFCPHDKNDHQFYRPPQSMYACPRFRSARIKNRHSREKSRLNPNESWMPPVILSERENAITWTAFLAIFAVSTVLACQYR